MKKIKSILAIIALVAAMAAPASAQVYQSKSYVKKTTVTKTIKDCKWKKIQGYIDVGARIPTVSYNEDGVKVNNQAGFEANIGFQRRIGCQGWYWGMNASFFTSGLSTPDTESRDGGSVSSVGGQLIPINFGWRTMLSPSVMLDLNIGYGFGAVSDPDLEDAGDVDTAGLEEALFVCIPVGIGLQINKFRVNVKYQLGGGAIWGYDKHRDYIEKDFWNSALRLSVGYAF